MRKSRRYLCLGGLSLLVLVCLFSRGCVLLSVFQNEISFYWSRVFTVNPDVYLAAVQPTPLPMDSSPLSAYNADQIASVAVLGMGRVHDVDFAPNGKYFVTATAVGIGFYDAITLSQQRFISTPGQVMQMLFSPDGELLVSASPVQIWDAATGKLLGSLGENGASGMAFSPDGSLLAVSADNEIHLWHLASKKLIRRLVGQTGGARGLSFSPDGKLLVAGSYGLYGDDAVYIWFVESETLAQKLTGHTDSVMDVAFSPDGQTFATASYDASIRIWRLDVCHVAGDPCASQVHILKRMFGSRVYSIDFSPDGRILAAGDDNGDILLWDVSVGRIDAGLRGDHSKVTGVAFSPDGEILVAGTRSHWLYGGKAKLTVWRLKDYHLLEVVDVQGDTISDLAFSHDGKLLAATGGWDCSLRFWRVADGSLLRRIDPEKCHSGMHSGSFSSGDQIFISVSSGKLFLWRAADGVLLDSFEPEKSSIRDAAFVPKTTVDGDLLAVGLPEKIQIWRLVQDKLEYLYDLDGDIRYRGGLSFSLDGTLLAAISKGVPPGSTANYSIHIWRVADGVELQVIPYHYKYDSSRSVAFSSDAVNLAVEVGNEIWVWDWQEGKLLYKQIGCDVVAFSPDGTLLVSGVSDGAVQLLRASDGSQIKVLNAHNTDSVNSIVFSPDGLRLAFGGSDGVVRIWGIPVEFER